MSTTEPKSFVFGAGEMTVRREVGRLLQSVKGKVHTQRAHESVLLGNLALGFLLQSSRPPLIQDSSCPSDPSPQQVTISRNLHPPTDGAEASGSFDPKANLSFRSAAGASSSEKWWEV